MSRRVLVCARPAHATDKKNIMRRESYVRVSMARARPVHWWRRRSIADGGKKIHTNKCIIGYDVFATVFTVRAGERREKKTRLVVGNLAMRTNPFPDDSGARASIGIIVLFFFYIYILRSTAV